MSKIIPEILTARSHTCPWVMITLLQRLSDGTLDINAEYQRDEVWPSIKKTRLQQSILGNMTIPNIIVNVKRCGDKDIYVVIDGKQRISACRDFKNGKVKFYNETNPDMTCTFNELDELYKKKFMNYVVNVTEYQGLTETQERNIFQRINYGENLTIGEKIQGLKTPIILKIIETKNIISPILESFGIKQKRASHNECTVALLALFMNKKEYVSKGKICIEFLKYITNEDTIVDMSSFKLKIKDTLDILTNIHDDVRQYSKKRRYSKKSYSKMKWTDILIYSKMLLDSSDISIIKKQLTSVMKYLIHISNDTPFLISKITEDDKFYSREYSNYISVFEKRSNTNVTRFFEERIESINNIAKYINKTPGKSTREEIYAKSKTSGKSTCKLCNIHEIYPECFHSAHIISKKNGGCPETSNGFPTCATCNTRMGSLDMDIYIKKNKIKLEL